ncbi:MAG: RDD family protein [Actinomycetota bacterium]|nr:RDD family protein [Actinomycetota bacterium]
MAGSGSVEHRSAGIVSRGTAAVIDLTVVSVLLGFLYLGLLLASIALNPGAFRFPSLDKVFSTAVAFGIAIVYLAGCWAVSGCTVGAVVMGLQVIGRRGGRLRPVIAVARAAAYVFFPIGLMWVAVDSQRRSLQDIVLGSRVVYAHP